MCICAPFIESMKPQVFSADGTIAVKSFPGIHFLTTFERAICPDCDAIMGSHVGPWKRIMLSADGVGRNAESLQISLISNKLLYRFVEMYYILR